MKKRGEYKCHKCAKKYTRKASLYVHMHLDCGQGAFVCIHCGRRTSREYNLKRHLFTMHQITTEYNSHMIKEV